MHGKVRDESQSVERTGKTTAIFGVRIKVLSVADHAGAQVRNGQGLLLVIAFAALGDGLDVGGHGFVDAINACEDLAIALASVVATVVRGSGGQLTIMPHVHLRFHCLEVIGEVGLDLASHALAGPLFETVEFAIDVHFGLML